MKIRNIITALLLSVSFTAAAAASQTAAVGTEPPSLNVNAKAALLMEPATGSVLLAQNPHEKLAPASVTKIMTMLLIYEAVADGKIKWDDSVTISEHAAGMGGSQVYLAAMERQPVRELLKSIVIASANDSAVAMAEFIAGSEEGFVLMMNRRAKELGMADTNFVNACGLDAGGHLTSAYDIALMTRELINKFPEVFEYTGIWLDKIVHKLARGDEETELANTNRLIRAYSGATGLKTGSTSGALYCISATAKRDGMQLISVVLGAPESMVRFDEAKKMFDYGFANYALTLGEPANTPKGSVKIYKGDVLQTDVMIKNQVYCLVQKGKNQALESKVEMAGYISAPAEKGAKAGEIVYYYEGNEVGRSDLITVESVKRASLKNMLDRVVKGWFSFS
ncbi:MAG: D-alanyl-D-alanine carboxypeptidase [Clostridiales bacterium]|jgi:D-alanyl-D-alanine carboxypeptidase (penicillin-binding protein 5/6)|nr:D-alanyl-D-alanine carboxypeptidase [Clostridiales bacterium]